MFAFGASIFDTLGGRGADAGHIVSWNVLEHFADATGDLTTTDGVSLFGTTAMQFDIQGPFSADNPVAIFEFEWAPDVLGSYVVEYETFSYLDVDQHHDVVVLIAKEPFEFINPEEWPVTEAHISFQVVPAPGGMVVLVLAGAWMRRLR
jgi:hypothetical protein